MSEMAADGEIHGSREPGWSRRRFLQAAAAVPAALAAASDALAEVQDAAAQIGGATAEEAARDEAFWFSVQQAFDLDARLILLNAGASNPMPRPVRDALIRHIEYINGSPLVNSYSDPIWSQRETVRRRLAAQVNCSPEEIALTRNTTEALNIVLQGIPLEPGDEVLATNYDYYSTLATLEQRAQREGIGVRQVDLPLPAPSVDELVEAVAAGFGPRTRVLLLSHVIDAVGQIMPVRRIADRAHARGIQVVVDGALSFGHVSCDVQDLGCDYFGTSLHKWLCAPYGTGFLYVRRERIADTWPLFGTAEPRSEDIRKFESIGTHAVAPILAVGQALDFHLAIGPERKAARLHFLKRYWADRIAREPRVRIGPSLGREHTCAIAHLGLEGVDSRGLARYFREQKGIYIYPIVTGPFDGVYVSPNVFTRLDQLDYFVESIRDVLQHGLPEA